MFWLNRILPNLTQACKSIIGTPQLLIESPLATDELEQMLELGAIPSFRFYFMLGLATAIASLGLIANSSATIIGAMIIAPLMNPIVSLSYALVKFKQRLLGRSALTILTGILWVILVSFLITQLVGTRITGSEILARANPNLLDLGVAMASGIAGAFALTRRSVSNALPGVAIAVALVPPLCVVGIGLALGSELIIDPRYRIANEVLTIENGSFLLFLTNFIAIVFCGGLVFLSQGYSNAKKAFAGLSLSLLSLIFIALPLQFSFQDLILRSIILRNLDELAYENPHWVQARLREIYINLEIEPPLIQFDIIAPSGVISETDVKVVQKTLSEKLRKPVDIQINLLEFKTLNY
ncbi:MAG: DUF389 domain-containing protein [Xenococcaceae cyanobacterium MO_188.B32]|nr:DUF389 domain-containing protein [Xenococcaceae cyanobacterium MO_188.B32]